MTIYIDAGMGAAGDMLTAALVEVLGNKEETVRELNHLGIPGISFHSEKSEKLGIVGTRMVVRYNGKEEGIDGEVIHHGHGHGHEHNHPDHGSDHHHHHGHSSLHDIEHIVSSHIHVDEAVKKDIMAVYRMIAEAESHVHGKTVDEIHFHEVGMMDAIADITAVCYLFSKLNLDKVVVSPIHVGSGTVTCAHGIMPVPAPATAYLLQGCPIYSSEIKGELCTPTGAALLKYFATEFGEMPIMKVSSIGYGMGKKDFERPNAVRIMAGEEEGKKDVITALECNVDDMTSEELGFAMERLMEEGALEIFATAVVMKKSRPGFLLSVLTDEDKKEKMISLIFSLTSTIGIRETRHSRYVLERKTEEVETRYGIVKKKISHGYGIKKEKFEYDDLATIARKEHLSIREVRESL
ncbi:MAG TPA: nickel pincer cofactor biosynthesis protein LarC [Sphaerochaeta sp.]|jgi:uncharacterized protein (TIGR00299 family) protein|nr:nickel pincer cofactor biosynthesis protein LarC [Sphaerochaeta sp.]HQB04794.1 nickel pincer cofactor biosynthesis protein LarC [Sphaerochaeta sp.]